MEKSKIEVVGVVEKPKVGRPRKKKKTKKKKKKKSKKVRTLMRKHRETFKEFSNFLLK